MKKRLSLILLYLSFKVIYSAPPDLKITAPSPKCVNSAIMDLLDYITVNGSKPQSNQGTFNVLQSPFGATNTSLINGHRFSPGWGRGVWEFKYSITINGETSRDSFFLNVLDTPDAVLLPHRIMCENEPALNLSNVLDQANSKGVSNLSWSGTYVSGNTFIPTSTKTKAMEGPYFIKLKATSFQGCVDTEYYQIHIRTLPEVSIKKLEPGNVCAGDAYPLEAVSKFDNGVQWQTIRGADGLFTAPNGLKLEYYHGNGDASKRSAWVRIQTLPLSSNEVCPQAEDSMLIMIHPYPVIKIDSPILKHAPYTANFTSTESAGIPDSLLQYRWDFGNGDTSHKANPKGIKYENKGTYQVCLTTINTSANCSTRICEKDFVKIMFGLGIKPDVTNNHDPLMFDNNLVVMNNMNVEKTMVYELNGELICTFNHNKNTSFNFKPGVYVVHIKLNSCQHLLTQLIQVY